MLVSLRWLSKYVSLPDDVDALAQRLALSGLNHESTEDINGETVFDLEVTSNRGDCLGHIGVAREISVLEDQPLKCPDPTINEGGDPIESSLRVVNEFSEACPRYTARLIRGVQIGPSPDRMIRDLQSVFWSRKTDGTLEVYKPINNVVDATNYVLMECGSPLHAFDHAKLAENTIRVRRGVDKETLTAIDHHQYTIDPSTCVIADGNVPQAIAGVMGGLESEVSESTTDIVIEAAAFTPLSVRRTARRLKLHSPSSYRFERRVDIANLDWASRRVCELIQETAGGLVAPGMIDTNPDITPRRPIRLRWEQLTGLLGIEVPHEEATRILKKLGCIERSSDETAVEVVPPTFRSDLSRPADLIEEIARIHGYDKIPEDAIIPVAASSTRTFDVVTEKIRSVLTAGGLSEAMTPSVVTAKLDGCLSPWTDAEAMRTQTPMLKGSQTLRRSIVPSLIESRGRNQAMASVEADLFEIAHVYLPSGGTHSDVSAQSAEQYVLAMISGKGYLQTKGLIESLFARLGIDGSISVRSRDIDGFRGGTAVDVCVDDDVIGVMGVVDDTVLKTFKLSGEVTAAEILLPPLMTRLNLVPQQRRVSAFPSIRRDLNFIVDEAVRWADLERVVRRSIGESLAAIEYQETYRDPQRDGAGAKRLLLTVELQKPDATLSGDQADEMVNRAIDAASGELSAKLVS